MTVSILALCAAVPAAAQDCSTSGNTKTCTYTDSNFDGLAISFDGGQTEDLVIDNEAQLTGYTDIEYGPYGIGIGVYGSKGSGSAPDGTDGVSATVTNSGAISVTSGGTGSQVPGHVTGITVSSIGGEGVEPSSNGDGGRGGDGGVISITNTGTIDFLYPSTQGLSVPVWGINAESQGGPGGDMNSGSGDQKGGNSGDGKAITIDNSATITMGTASSALRVGSDARGIRAISHGNSGGSENGEGGAGGDVTITNSGGISAHVDIVGTGQYGLQGILARSNGTAGAASNDNSDDGGRGEDGRQVSVTNGADIYLTYAGTAPQNDSAGIFAHSAGGAGGTSADKSTGGAGGSGSATDQDSNGRSLVSLIGGTITTEGDYLSGVVARSEGGQGGNGNGDDNSTGGAGGNGGTIEVDMSGSAAISTSGVEGYGVLGQSIGALGGGDAGAAGAGGDGGAVIVRTETGNVIRTAGDYGVGITAHSVGGYGGTGEDFTGVLAGSGGTGGNGGDANTVLVNNAATIATSGDHAYGVLAQSVGGSGGTGGISKDLTVSLGGGGGGGGGGETVQITNTGTITTTGDYAVGLLGQSLSGGGGAAGTAGGILAVGGSAGAGANVDFTSFVTNSGDITTSGASAIGIALQAVGGGGGTGGGESGVVGVGGSGTTGGNGGYASLFAVGGTVKTSGDHAYGLVSQSIGGGGGNGGDANDISLGIGIGVGGSGSGGGVGRTACAANFYDGCTTGTDFNSSEEAPRQSQSAVQTSGDFAHGVIVQSTGGGGGNGGDFFGDAGFALAAVQIGGSGGTAAQGGAATAKFDALDLVTSGANAKGMIVQSLGGGGGNGGNSTAFDGVTPVGIQVGGGAGGGGAGGAAEVSLSDSTLVTSGANAGGILAQSYGGGGGTGGAGYGADASLLFSMDVAIGGTGGGGGDADEVTVSLDRSCVVTGLDGGSCPDSGAGTALGNAASSSHAISVQSNGGGGGTGGTSMAAALAASVPTGEGESVSVAGTLSVGGSGGSGGNGGSATITLDSASTLTTGGDGSYGILAQSNGGGGGDGGAAGSLSGSIGIPNSISVDMAMSLGGAGGSGGHGSDVDVALRHGSSIATHGANANGIVAQSIGGGGGDGNVGNATNDRIGRGMNISTHIGLGGKGGSGGTGGAVTVSVDADSSIATHGTGSHGLVAQSIGGGGGTGQGGSVGLTAQGFSLGEALKIKNDNGTPPKSVLKFSAKASMELNVGGTTGNGNTGGTLNVTTDGDIRTEGDDADAVVLQSIGGGGGIGGTAGSDSANTSEGQLPRPELAVSTTSSSTLSFGGTGGTGGTGGKITYSHTGTAATKGDFADAIVVQSIGGGGGAGGSATNGDGDQEITVDLALGGTGGVSGDGGDIDVSFDSTNGGAIATTEGSYAHAILLHSVGAGGGHGGSGNSAGAGTTNVDVGGGSVHSLKLNAGISLGAGIGGNGGASGNGGDITVSGTGAVTARTTGTNAHAFMAQSIGAGGGNGDVGGSSASNGPLDIDLSVTLGGDGGAAGHGGTVDVDTGAIISTQGHRAIGMLLQSIGGGGGSAGETNSENLASVSLQSRDGSSGAGGAVTLNLSSGQIVTTGIGSHAIIAQSIGGGGGIAGDIAASTLQTNAPVPNSDASTGSGASVDLTVGADISTSNRSAFGIIAQSVGGRGGLWGSDGTLYAGSYGGSGGDASTVTVTQDGTLTTSGEDSIAIFGQSVGVESNGKVAVTVNGDVTGGHDEGSAIYVSEGNANALVINSGGSVTAGNFDDDDTAGYAIRYLGSYDQDQGFSLSVSNYGDLNGEVLLVSADGTTDYTYVQSSTAASAAPAPQVGGTLTNAAGGTWRMQGRSMAHVINAGTVSTLGAAPGREVQLTGDFTQKAGGILELGADFGGDAADHIQFNGDVALDGKLRIAAAGIAPGTRHRVLSFGGAVSGGLTAEDSAAVDYRLEMVGAEAIVSVAGTSFGTAFDGLDSNQAAVGAHLDRIFDAGAEGYAGVLADFDALARQEDAGASFAAALGSFTPGSALAAAAVQTMFARARMDGALRCRNQDRAWPGEADDCAWAEIGGQSFDQDGTGGYDGNQFVVSGGARTLTDSGWHIGFALGYEHGSFTADGGHSSADGDGAYAALAAGREIGGFDLGLAVTASYGRYDLERHVLGADPGTVAKSDTDITSLGARLHGSRVYGGDGGYVRPALDLDLVHTRTGGYTETGAGAYDLAVEAQTQTILVATPSVEVGRRMSAGDGMSLTMFAGAALSLSNADEWNSEARLAMADPSAGSFTTSVPVADKLGRLSLGLSLARSERFEARIEYGGSFGSDFASHGIGLGIHAWF